MLTGRVVDLDGRPVADAEVDLHNVENEHGICDDDPGVCIPGGWIDDSLTSDANGTFSRWTHPRDLIGVVVTAPGFEPQVVYDVGYEDALTITLEPGDGAFDPAVVRGVLRDSSGAPLPGQKVFLGAGSASSYDTAVTTDGGGHYFFQFDPLTRYWSQSLYLLTESPAVDDWARTRVAAGPRGYYEPGAVYDVDFTVETPGTVAGLVTDEAGTPLRGVVISSSSGAVARTDDAGRYELVLYPGRFWLVFSRSGYDGSHATYEGTVGAGEKLEVPVRVLPKTYRAPSAMTRVRASARSPYRAVVRGYLPADLGGSALEQFAARCQVRDGRWRVRWSDDRPVVVRHLRPGRSYHCQMRARNAFYWGPWSGFSDWFRTPRR